jgi:hypothetical protein
VRLEGLGQLKNSKDLIGTPTRNLPACSIVSQETTLPRALKQQKAGYLKTEFNFGFGDDY